jgi:hypothetical protein
MGMDKGYGTAYPVLRDLQTAPQRTKKLYKILVEVFRQNH